MRILSWISRSVGERLSNPCTMCEASRGRTLRWSINGCLYLGALRVSEACKLERRDVNWERGTIRVRDAKTPAGYRDVPVHRMLFKVMLQWWTRHPDTRPKALLFPTARGTPRDKDNARMRVLLPAVRRAAELLHERSQNPMPERTNKRGETAPNVQTHSGRRTAITWWAEAGYDEREVMNWVGHEDAALTCACIGRPATARRTRASSRQWRRCRRRSGWRHDGCVPCSSTPQAARSSRSRSPRCARTRRVRRFLRASRSASAA